MSKECPLKEIENQLQRKYNVFKMFDKFNMSTLIKRSNIAKTRGIEASIILKLLILLPFLSKTINSFVTSSKESIFKLYSKDTFYRLMNDNKVNWRSILLYITSKILRSLNNNTSWHKRYLIIDDTTIVRRGNHIEYISRVYDHIARKTVKGFKAVLIGITDKSSFFPLDFSLQSGRKKIFNKLDTIKIDNRTISAKRRSEVNESKLDLALSMLERVKRNNIDARAVIFDTWYNFPSFVNKICE